MNTDPDADSKSGRGSESDSDADSESAPDEDSTADSAPVALVHRYYDALDEHAYEDLEDVLAADFVQRRPDRTFEDRASFVRFMCEDRPNPNTSHELATVVGGDSGGDGRTVAARGRVRDGESGTVLFAFADFFEIEDGRIARLETYAR